MRKLLPYLIGLALIPLVVTAARRAVGLEQAWEQLPLLYAVMIGGFVLTLAVLRLVQSRPRPGKK